MIPSRQRKATHLLDGNSSSFSHNSGQLDDGLHSLDLTLDDGVKVFLSDFRIHDKVYGSDVVFLVFRGRCERKETVVQVLGGEGGEGGLQTRMSLVSHCAKVRTYQSKGEGVQRLEQGVQSGDSVIVTVFTLQSSSVESNVPICQLVNEVEQTRHDGVQSVGCEARSAKYESRKG